MTMTETSVKQFGNRALDINERAQFQCQTAADLEQRGQYEAARDALADLWRGIGQRPELTGLSELTSGEVLLRAGTLSGWFASAIQDKDNQEAAKDLISESITRFEALGEITKASDALSELGFCYWREGRYDDARVIYSDALNRLAAQDDPEIRGKILIRLVLVESGNGRYTDSLRILTDAAEMFAASTNDALKGKFHNDLACVLIRLGEAEHRPDYIDRAIIEYTAASIHFERAGHTSYFARAENNLGFLLHTVGRYDEAHEHLNRARHLFIAESDRGSVAQVDETRARVLLAQGRTQAAETIIREAVRVLSTGGEQGLLAEALTTQGRIHAKLGKYVESIDTLRRAADLAQDAGAVEDAGRALLTLMEEHAGRIAEHELLDTYERANNLLKETQDIESITRLRASALRIMSACRASLSKQCVPAPVDFWANFNLNERVHTYEASYVQQALIDGRGSITRAARLLGLHHHATLAAMLDETQGRHKALAHLRTPPEPRKQSIINHGQRRRRKQTEVRTVNILCVEDYPLVADAVKETLEEVGWKVELCSDGTDAIRRIESKAPFRLLILDNDLPGKDGLELARRVRELPHRRRTPIIMLSGSDVEQDALRVGVNAFLRKPQDISQLTDTVTRLLAKNNSGK